MKTDLSDDDILARLLALNLERAKKLTKSLFSVFSSREIRQVGL